MISSFILENNLDSDRTSFSIAENMAECCISSGSTLILETE